MKSKDLPIVLLGVGILYLAYLIQNRMIRMPEGFQDQGAPPAMPPGAMPPGEMPPGAMPAGQMPPSMPVVPAMPPGAMPGMAPPTPAQPPTMPSQPPTMPPGMAPQPGMPPGMAPQPGMPPGMPPQPGMPPGAMIGTGPPGMGSPMPSMTTPPNQAQLQAISSELKQIAQNAQKIDTISQQLQQMSQPQPPPREGFQSYENPYNMTSPSISQAYEFRLGKKSLTDEVLGFMRR